MLLEMCLHNQSWFVTLTYEDSKLPEDGSVVPRELVLFWKRLRAYGHVVRYYAVGEYGERTGRPHYHAAIFGLNDVSVRTTRDGDYLASDAVSKAWQCGGIHIGELNAASGAYLTGYLSKKWTKERTELRGRHPEFCRMSKNPGIGGGVAPVLAEFWNSREGARELSIRRDVSAEVRIAQRKYPLGRYLLSKVRESAGYDGRSPDEVRHALQVRSALLVQTVGELEKLFEAGSVSALVADRNYRESFKRRVI